MKVPRMSRAVSTRCLAMFQSVTYQPIEAKVQAASEDTTVWAAAGHARDRMEPGRIQAALCYGSTGKRGTINGIRVRLSLTVSVVEYIWRAKTVAGVKGRR